MGEPADIHDLQQFVRDNQVKWGVYPIIEKVRGERVPVGYELELSAVCDSPRQGIGPNAPVSIRLFGGLNLNSEVGQRCRRAACVGQTFLSASWGDFPVAPNACSARFLWRMEACTACGPFRPRVFREHPHPGRAGRRQRVLLSLG
jgi:hypothetical protein